MVAAVKGIRCQRAKTKTRTQTRSRRPVVASAFAFAFAVSVSLLAMLALATDAGAVGEGAHERTPGPLVHKPNAPVATPGAGTVPDRAAGDDEAPATPASAIDTAPVPTAPAAPDIHAGPEAYADSDQDEQEAPDAPAPSEPLPTDRIDAGSAMPQCRVRESCDATDGLAHTDSDPANEPRAQSRDAPRLAMPAEVTPEALGIGAGVGAFAATIYFLRAAVTAGVVRMWAALAVRRSGGELDSHPVRSSILRHLDAHPGATTRELAKVAGVPYRRVVYHIAMLERAQRLRVRSVGRKRLHFPVGAPRVHDEDLALRALVDPSSSSGRILAHVAAQPGPSLSRIARLFGLSVGNTHYHLQRLRESGLVHVVRQGACIRHYVTERGRAWLHRVTPDVDASVAQPAPLPMMAPIKQKRGVAV